MRRKNNTFSNQITFLDEEAISQNYKKLSRKNHTLENLVEDSNFTFYVDTSVLRHPMGLLRNLPLYNPPETYICRCFSQLKSLNKLSEERRLILIPSIHEEFMNTEKFFLRSLVDNMFRYRSNDMVSYRLFELFYQNEELKEKLPKISDFQLEKESQELFPFVEGHLAHSYVDLKTENTRKISYHEQLLYLSAHIGSYRERNSFALITHDRGFLSQPPLNDNHSPLIFYPEFFVGEAPFVDEYALYGHK